MSNLLPSDTATLDKLYLEYSRIAQVRTIREVNAYEDIRKILQQMYVRGSLREVTDLSQNDWRNLANSLQHIISRLA
jgi:hypothetical protein